MTEDHEIVNSDMEGGLERKLLVLTVVGIRNSSAMGKNEFFLQKEKQKQK